jgi:glycosyltransferase involved in cell wall biosynthesis
MIEILKKHDDHIFLILGAKFDEKLYAEMMDLVKSSRMENRILIHDALEHCDYLNLLSEVNLVVNSSISEGMSNAIMEAMLLGIPVLARENEGNLKLIIHMKNGLIFRDKSDFEILYNKIYSDHTLRNSLIENSKAEIEGKYGYDQEICSYKNLLSEFSKNYYSELDTSNTVLKLIFSKGVHPFSVENNEIFSVNFHSKRMQFCLENPK